MSAADRAVKTLASQLATAPGLVVEPGSNLDLPGKDPSAPLYRFVPVAGSADPYGPLVFQASGPVTNGTVSTQYRLLRVWTCATNATLPAGVTFQGTQVGLFLYRDFQDAL